MSTIHPVILAGGSGTRLWPLSRKSFPKQFSSLAEGPSLFQRAVQRTVHEGFAAARVVTGDEFRFIVRDQLAGAGAPEAEILIEPSPKNTGPAILAAAHHVARQEGPEAVLLVCPSDHLIGDDEAFVEAVEAALTPACEGRLVTLGVRPDRVETGYGYLEPAGELLPGRVDRPLAAYIEKPARSVAERFVVGGRHLWSAGIFVFRARDLIAAFERLDPDTNRHVARSVTEATRDLGFLRLDVDAFEGAAVTSIDRGVMERSENLSVVELRSPWSDLGSWDAVWRGEDRDDAGVATHGAARAVDCKNTLLRSDSEGQEVVGLGLEDIVVVAMRDAVLVSALDRVQDVRSIVGALEGEGIAQATSFPRCHRPWGWYETLSLGTRFQVKRIMVKPGGKLSLQSHVHRAEHWVVVEGTARVTVGEETNLFTENESVYVPVGERHRLENPGRVDLHIIEIQTGTYLGEDDIVRYDDVYARDARG